MSAARFPAPRTPAPPATLRIGPYSYRVVIDTEWCAEHNLAGQHRPMDEAIVLHGEQSPARAADSMLHEVAHACLDVADHASDDEAEHDERVIRTLTPTLIDTLKRNPALVGYLLPGHVLKDALAWRREQKLDRA